MPAIPNLIERLVLFRLNRGPGPAIDLVGAAGFEAVALALELDIFETLAATDAGLRPAELAERTGADPDGVVRLCEFLVAERYLEERGRRYAVTDMTERWLLRASATDMGPFFTFWHELVLPFWRDELETAVREGAPSRTIYEWFDEEPDRWPIAQAGFRSAATLVVDDVADVVDVPDGAERLLDVGGGHGLYAFELCRRHLGLSATVFDLAGALEALEVPDDLAHRVDTTVGDYRTDDLGSGYDVALVFNVIHAQDPEGNRALFERVADALAPGGRVVVLDQWVGTGRSPVSRTALQFIALNYLVTLDATVYPHEDAAGWLREAGFVGVTPTSVGPLSGLAVVEARKPAAP